ncbi:hypothetical protein V3C99_017500 [Haemonchus contortus]
MDHLWFRKREHFNGWFSPSIENTTDFRFAACGGKRVTRRVQERRKSLLRIDPVNGVGSGNAEPYRGRRSELPSLLDCLICSQKKHESFSGSPKIFRRSYPFKAPSWKSSQNKGAPMSAEREELPFRPRKSSFHADRSTTTCFKEFPYRSGKSSPKTVGPVSAKSKMFRYSTGESRPHAERSVTAESRKLPVSYADRQLSGESKRSPFHSGGSTSQTNTLKTIWPEEHPSQSKESSSGVDELVTTGSEVIPSYSRESSPDPDRLVIVEPEELD